ncbi:MAG: hypothetical protein H6Q12_214 [Bacteroidetes bacterium]|nr:hypothetical protein [Bacteroidota bacterium]
MKKLLFTVFATVLMLSGCSNEEAATVSPDNTLVALSVSSVSFPAVKTKATTSLSGGSIGVFLGSANGYTAINNVQYTYSAGAWTKTSGGDIYLGSSAASVCAYYPYSASVTNSSSVSLQSQIYTSAADLCYAPYITNLKNSAQNAAFVMSHAYSRITFTITRDATYTGTCNITDISLTNSGLKTLATFNITNGTYTTGTNGSVSFNPSISSIASGANTSTSVLLVPVTGLTGNIDLAFTIDGASFSTSIPVSTAGLATLSAGINYKINVTIKYTSLTNNSVSTTDWNTQTAISGGDIK